MKTCLPILAVVITFMAIFIENTEADGYGSSHGHSHSAKGQLISKCLYEKSVSSKIPTKLFLDFCPEIFCSSVGASWKLFGLPVGFLIYDITY